MGRDVKIDLSGEVIIPVDAAKAIIAKIESLDRSNALKGKEDLVERPIVVFGQKGYKVYAFNLTTDYEGGEYKATYVESAPPPLPEEE